MPRTRNVNVDLRGIALVDSRSGRLHAVGELPSLQVLTLIRHRY